jgi:RNA polymerase sigma factor (sigma-70 family)
MLNQTPNEIISLLLPSIRATVGRIVGEKNAGMVDDLVNDTVVRLLAGGLDRCDGRASAKSWVTICARNVCLDYVRTSYVKRSHVGVCTTGINEPKKDAGEGAKGTFHGLILDGEGEEDAERAYEAHKLQAAMAELLSAEEQTFIFAIADGASLEEAVCAAGLPWSKATASRRHKAIRALLSE